MLQWASSGGSLEVVEWLVKEAGAKVTHRNKVRSFFFLLSLCSFCVGTISFLALFGNYLMSSLVTT